MLVFLLMSASQYLFAVVLVIKRKTSTKISIMADTDVNMGFKINH